MTDRQTDRQTDRHDYCESCGQRLQPKIVRKTDINGRFDLFCHDFRDIQEIIPAASIDAVIADPPYGSGGFTVKDKMKSAKSKYVSSNASYQHSLPDIDGDALHPKAWEQLMMDACLFAKTVLKNDALLAFFIDWRNLGEMQDIIAASGLQLRGVAVWDKRNGRPVKNGFRLQTEYLIWATKGRIPKREKPVYLPGVLRHTTLSANKMHITQKPDSLMDEIMPICPEGGSVLDMFMGSGSTGVAALKSGRKFIGIESVPEYFNAAVKRCEDTLYNDRD